MQDRGDSRAQKSSEFRASIHELYQDDGAQLLLEKPSRAALAGVYGLFVGLLVALVWAWLARTDITIRVRGELRPVSPVYAVAFPFKGELVNLYVTPGMPVKKGDIIARVRSSELLTQTVEDLHAQIDLVDAEKAYALALQAGSIPAERPVPEDDLSIRQAKLRLELARLRAMASAVDPDHIDAEGALRLFSPIDGFVLEVFSGHPQTPVAAHQPLAQIAATRNLAFYMEVPERERWRLREGLPVRIQLDAAAEHRILPGVLAYLAPIPEPSASSAEPVYPGRVDIHESAEDSNHGPLRPGMHGRADIIAERRHLIDLVF
jgi:multidrug efflux pump subunit AcrA (membrane-fusion protein)